MTVNGPKEALFVNGNRILGASGVVQNSPGISVSICVAGYNEHLSITVWADESICGRKTADVILQYITESLRHRECLLP